ncbi:arylsulfatase [Falsirhodobacter sp. 1013]|uniref:arylsulfatase n=1 Tax=Falsirhodobacter sp. 1013 TaxID=3417566 RepID=UPI003EC08913
MTRLATLLGTAVALALPHGALAHGTTERPNLLLIVADDLGYADTGPFGGEIATPNLDALAGEGVLFTNFHANASCAVTRAMLLTGIDNHLAGVGQQGNLPANQPIRAGYEAVLSDRVATVAELLSDAGYRTSIAGKWHQGSDWDSQPQNRGFDKAAVLLEGGGAHFKQDEMGILKNSPFTFMHDGRIVEVPDDYYSSTYFTDQLIEAIGDGQEEAPFFAFGAFTAPHWPIQAPKVDIDAYAGRYDAGWEVLATERIRRQKELGLLRADFPEQPEFERARAWDSLSAEEKRTASRHMEAYAGMVTAFDREIGRLVDHLKAIGEYDTTAIVFMSDNGAEGGVRGEPDWVAANFNQSYDNIGQANSFVEYGPGWAQAGTVPNRLYKYLPYEGGNHVPAIIHYPAAFPARHTDALASVIDVTPTLLDLAGVEHPGIRFDRRDILPMEGASMAGFLRGDTRVLNPEGHVVAFESAGFASLRRGDWKIVFEPKEHQDWQLYDMTAMTPEKTDVAAAHPEVTEDMRRAFVLWAGAHNVPVTERGLPRGLQ